MCLVPLLVVLGSMVSFAQNSAATNPPTNKRGAALAVAAGAKLPERKAFTVGPNSWADVKRWFGSYSIVGSGATAPAPNGNQTSFTEQGTAYIALEKQDPNLTQWQASMSSDQGSSTLHMVDMTLCGQNGQVITIVGSGNGQLDHSILEINPTEGLYWFSAGMTFPATDTTICEGQTNTQSTSIGAVGEDDGAPLPTSTMVLSGSLTVAGLEGIPSATLTFNLSPVPDDSTDSDDNCQSQGSNIECQSQNVGEDVPIVGTSFFLHYGSNRAIGRAGADAAAIADARSLGGWTLSAHHALGSSIQTACYLVAGGTGSCNAFAIVPKALFFGSGSSRSLAKIQSPIAQNRKIYLTSESGSEVYVFDASTFQHLQTLRPMTGTVLYNFGYDQSGRLVTVTDASGATTIERDGGGNPIAITAPYGQKTILGVDSNGYLNQITDPAGNTITPKTSSLGLLDTLIDANKNTYTFQYDSLGRLQTDSAPTGGSTQLIRTDGASGFSVVKTTAAGTSGQPSSVVLTTTYQTTFSSNSGSTSQQLTSTWPDGLKATQANMQQIGQLLDSATLPNGTSSSQTLGADPRWGIQVPIAASQTTALGNLTMNVTSTRTASLGTPGNPFSLITQSDVTTVNGKTYTSTYSAGARAYTFTTPAGRSINTTLDSQERVISSGIVGLLPTKFCYDNLGRLVTVTKGTRIVSLGYDSNGFLQSVTPGTVQQQSLAVVGVTPANGAIGVPVNAKVLLGFNEAVNPATVSAATAPIQANQAVVTGSYTVNDSTISFAPSVPFRENTAVSVTVTCGVQDAAGNPAQPFSSSFTTISPLPPPPTNIIATPDDSFTYWPDGHLKTRTLPDGRVISYTFDPNGNLSTLRLPSGAVHTFSPTPVNLLSSYTPPTVTGTGQTTFSYNVDRQPAQITRPDGLAITYNYEKDTSTQPAQGTGRLSSLVTPTSTISYKYDPTTGNLHSASISGGESLIYGYNGPLPTSSTWSGVIGGTVGRTYDNNFRIQTQSINGGNAISFSYDDDGFVQSAGALAITPPTQNNSWTTSTALGNVSDSWISDQYGQLSTYNANLNGAPIYKLQVTRDSMGRISTKVETIAGKTSTYTYDYWPAGELKTVALNGTAIANYTYDPDSNMQPPLGTPLPAYDAQDRLLVWGKAAYAYTANGELLKRTVGSQITKYNYDALGNLQGVTQPDGTKISYIVDPENRRIGKQVNGTLKQAFLYDGLKIVAELDGNGNIVSRFVYAMKPNVPDYMVKGGVIYRVVSDNLGSPRLLVNTSNGQVAEQVDYDAFGNVINDTNPGFQPFGFAGGLYDPDTKLIRFGARDYDSSIGRWTAKDQMIVAGTAWNLYLYVENDPVNRIDPTGFDWLYNLSDFAAGMGSVLSFGLTDLINEATGASAQVNKCGSWYTAGNVAGFLNSIAIGGLEGLEEGLEQFPEDEWSHWVPDRLKTGRGGAIPDFIVDSNLNGQFVSPLDHALNDPFRYLKGMTSTDKNPILLQQWNRIPPWLTGAAAGALYGAASMDQNGVCGCH